MPEEILDIAKERGNSEIIILLSPNSQDRTNEAKNDLKNAILDKTAGFRNLVPKSAEFTYNKKIDKMKPLLTSTQVSYDKLLQELHVPPVHVGVKENQNHKDVGQKEEEWDSCPVLCSQKKSCLRIRETYKLVQIIIKQLEKNNPVFKLTIIGSVREGSRVFSNDEADLHLSLNEGLKRFTYFDNSSQQLMFKTGHKGKNTKEYMTENYQFKSTKFALDFLQCVYEIISNLKLPEDFTMKPLSTNFSPCLICMKMQYGEPQAYRCQHVPDCPVHIRCQCEDREKCSCRCDCKQFSSPSLTHSKIGAVLHLEWVETDGTTFNLDCDLNVPTVPCGTRYNGDTHEISMYLRKNKPVNWVEEDSKLVAMTEAQVNPYNIDQDDWPIKFRMINRDTVLPRQVIV